MSSKLKSPSFRMVHLLDVYSIRENLFWVRFAFTFFFLLLLSVGSVIIWIKKEAPIIMELISTPDRWQMKGCRLLLWREMCFALLMTSSPQQKKPTPPGGQCIDRE